MFDDLFRARRRFALGAFVLLLLGMVLQSAPAAEYYVDGQSPDASDDQPGTAEAPWKTVSRAARAEELRPGDTVVIRSGAYRESVDVTVSGEPGRPITFTAAPGARVVLKGSEQVRGPWTRVTSSPGVKEPYPNAFTDVWKIELGEEFFTDPRFQGNYADKSRRWVSQVFVDEALPLQRIGPDPIYANEPYLKLTIVGRGLADLIQDSFFFDAATQTLYVKMAGEPGWHVIEVGVRGFVLTGTDLHDLVFRGLEMRHNRQPGGQWSMVSFGRCRRVTFERCRVYGSDFCGLGVGQCRECTVRECDLSYNGNTGLGMGQCEDCLVERCTLLANNYRRFHPGWHCGGMKCIPGNLRCTVRGCEVAYNVNCDGIWFDSDNAQIRILGNVCHHNDACGIFFEINKGGGVIADNLVYANRGRGIYISGSQKTWVVSNTVAFNQSGIVAMPRGDDWPLEDVRVLNNLLLANRLAADGQARGADLTLYMGADQSPDRTVTSNHSDYNVFSTACWTPTMRHSWNPDNTLAEWQKRFGEDQHSKLLPVTAEQQGTGFRLQATGGLEAASELPEEVKALVPEPGRVGSSLSQWP
jgi:hypothetical protein